MMKRNVCMILTAAVVSMGLTGCAQMYWMRLMQSIEMNTMEDITDDSIDYIHLMGQNLDTLRQTLRK